MRARCAGANVVIVTICVRLPAPARGLALILHELTPESAEITEGTNR